MCYIDPDEMNRSLDIIQEQSDPEAFRAWRLRKICADCPLARKAIDGEQ